MKLLPVVFAASSIACGITQSLALSAENGAVCPATCSIPERELLNMVKEYYPDILPEIERNFGILPSGTPINDILNVITPEEEHTEQPETIDGLPNIKVPYVRVEDSTKVSDAIKKLPTIIPSSIIDKLISQKPKTLDAALDILSNELGTNFAHSDLDAPIDTDNLVKELRALKRSGVKVNRLTIISRILKHLKPLSSDKHRLVRITKFFRNIARNDSTLLKLFSHLLPSENVPNATTMPFNELVARIVKNNPDTHLSKTFSKGDCGCFDFIDSPVEIANVGIPDTSAVAKALASLPEDIPSATVNKLIASRPNTLGNALRLISKSLGRAFDASGLDIPIDASRFVADLKYAAQKNNGKINRYTLVGYVIRNMKSESSVPAFRAIKFFRNIVKNDPPTKGLFSQLIPSAYTDRIPEWSSKDLIKQIVKYNPGSDITEIFTGKSTVSKPEPRRSSDGRRHQRGPFGSPAVGGSSGAVPKIGVPNVPKTGLPNIQLPKTGLPTPKIGIPTPKIGIPKLPLPNGAGNGKVGSIDGDLKKAGGAAAGNGKAGSIGGGDGGAATSAAGGSSDAVASKGSSDKVKGSTSQSSETRTGDSASDEYYTEDRTETSYTYEYFTEIIET